MLFTLILGLFFSGPPLKVKPPPRLEPHEALYRVNQWIDSASELEDYGRQEEYRYQKEKQRVPQIWPTLFYSPFPGGDWCQAIRKEEREFPEQG